MIVILLWILSVLDDKMVLMETSNREFLGIPFGRQRTHQDERSVRDWGVLSWIFGWIFDSISPEPAKIC